MESGNTKCIINLITYTTKQKQFIFHLPYSDASDAESADHEHVMFTCENC